MAGVMAVQVLDQDRQRGLLIEAAAAVAADTMQTVKTLTGLMEAQALLL